MVAVEDWVIFVYWARCFVYSFRRGRGSLNPLDDTYSTDNNSIKMYQKPIRVKPKGTGHSCCCWGWVVVATSAWLAGERHFSEDGREHRGWDRSRQSHFTSGSWCEQPLLSRCCPPSSSLFRSQRLRRGQEVRLQKCSGDAGWKWFLGGNPRGHQRPRFIRVNKRPRFVAPRTLGELFHNELTVIWSLWPHPLPVVCRHRECAMFRVVGMMLPPCGSTHLERPHVIIKARMFFSALCVMQQFQPLGGFWPRGRGASVPHWSTGVCVLPLSNSSFLLMRQQVMAKVPATLWDTWAEFLAPVFHLAQCSLRISLPCSLPVYVCLSLK